MRLHCKRSPYSSSASSSGWWLYPKIVYLPKTAIYLRYNWAVSWLGIEPTTYSRKFSVLTSTGHHRATGSHTSVNCEYTVNEYDM